MEFLRNIKEKNLRRVCFDESLDILCDNDIIGSFTISFEPTKAVDVYSFNSKFYIEIDESSGGFEITSLLTTNLKTIELQKYEFSKDNNSNFERKTNLQVQTDKTYKLTGKTISDENETMIETTFLETDMMGFVSEASGLIIQRLMAFQHTTDIITLATFGRDLKLCKVIYTPLGEEVVNLRKLNFTVYRIVGQIISKTGGLWWTSYYHHSGLMMFYNQDNNPLHCLFPPESDKMDSKLYVDLQDKHGLRYFYTIGWKHIKPLLFPEICKLLYGGNVGFSLVDVDTISFLGSECLAIQHHKLTNVKDGFEKCSIVSHVNEYLETLQYLEYEVFQRNMFQEQKVMYIYMFDDSISVNTIELTTKSVSRYSLQLSKKEFEGFLSKASSIILQRLLAKRGLQYNLTFSTFCENMTLSKVMFAHRQTFPPGDYRSSSNIFGLECCVIPKIGNISIWNYSYSTDGRLICAAPLGYPIQIIRSDETLHPKQKLSGLDIFNYSKTFESGCHFLQCLDAKDLLGVLFDETLKVLSSSGEDAGNLNIAFVNKSTSKDQNIMLCMESSITRGGKTFVTSFQGKLTLCLDTLEQTMMEKVMDGEVQLFEKKVIISRLPNQYHITQITTKGKNNVSTETVIQEDPNIPFVSESSCLVIDRLIVRKKVSDSLTFMTLNASLSPCLLKYRVLPKEWWILNGAKCEVFVIERAVMPIQSKVQKIPSLSWKLKFSQEGYSIERSQMNQTFTMSPSLNEVVLCNNDKYPMLPLSATHDPPFDWFLSEFEVKSLLFNDQLIVVSSEGMQIGSYSVTVNRVKYKNETDAFLVETHIFASFKEEVYGNISTAYLSLNLEILNFHQLQFMKDNKIIEKSISATKDFDGYTIQSIQTENSVVNYTTKKWCFPKNKTYVCESSLILIRRLIAIRRLADSLDFITLNSFGKASNIQLIPQSIESDVVLIRTLSPNYDVDFETKLTQTGYTVTCGQISSMGRILHPCFISDKDFQTPSSTESTQSAPNLVFTAAAFKMFESHDLDSLLSTEELDILADTNEEIGKFILTTDNVHYKGQHCLLLQTKVFATESTTELLTSTADLISYPFVLLKHMHTCFVQAGSSSIEKRIYLSRKDNVINIKKIVRFKEAHEVMNESTLSQNIDGFMSEASCHLFQRLLAKKDIQGHYQFVSIDVNQNLCQISIRTIGHKERVIDGIKVKLFGVEVQISPFQKCSMTWRSYFDEKGVLLESKPCGLPITLKKTQYVKSEAYSLDYPLRQHQLKFIHSIELNDLDLLLFADDAYIIYKERVQIGKYVVLVESVHYEEQHCFHVCMNSTVDICGKNCSTYISAILGRKLEILAYFQQEYVSPDVDMKMKISHNENTCNIDIFHVKGQEVFEKSWDIPCSDYPILCCEGVNILVLRLLTIKRIKTTLEFTGIDKIGDLGQIFYHSLGWRSIRIYNDYRKVWRIMTEMTYKDAQILSWEYNMSSDGHMLSRKQSDTPVIIIVAPEKCAEFKDSM